MPIRLKLLTLSSFGLFGLFTASSAIYSQPTPPPTQDVGIFDQNAVARADTTPVQEGVQPQARGQVHEAFATPSATTVEPGPIVTKEPPALLEEMPPEEKPEGEDVEWMHGYWAFNAESQDFDWITGVWRKKPQGMEWVHGSWAKVDGGWQWMPGHWQSLQQTNIEVTPTPPPVPNTIDPPCPGEDYMYVPGCWIYRECRFVWRPACWLKFRPGFVYVCARWVRTHCGWIFYEGYYDHCWEERGWCFAPVCIDIRFRNRAGWCYKPCFILHHHCLQSSLFVNRCGFYSFGDYYHERYQRLGYTCWTSYRLNRQHCEPLFLHCRYDNRANHNWERNLVALQTARFRGEAPCPPRTLELQRALVHQNGIAANHRRDLVLLAPVSRINTNAVKVTKLDQTRVLEQQRLSVQRLDLGRQRVELLNRAATTTTPLRVGEAPRVLSLNLPTTPVRTAQTTNVTPTLPSNTNVRPTTTVDPTRIIRLDPKAITPRTETNTTTTTRIDPNVAKPRFEPSTTTPITPRIDPNVVKPRIEPNIAKPRFEPSTITPRIDPPRITTPRVEPRTNTNPTPRPTNSNSNSSSNSSSSSNAKDKKSETPRNGNIRR